MNSSNFFNSCNLNNCYSKPSNSGIVFIDPSVDEYETLRAGVLPGLEVFMIDPRRDGVAQISDILSDWIGMSSLHIVSHGAPGSLRVGSVCLSYETIDRYSRHLKYWTNALSEAAGILLYGCEIAKGDRGAGFVQKLSRLVDNSIAASTSLTGNVGLNGNWDLEFTTGSITAAKAFSVKTMIEYRSVLFF